MSPTVFRMGKYRFYFFSREEERRHVHVVSAEGEAKFWIDPSVELATSSGLTKRQVNYLHKVVEEHRDEIGEAWQGHFEG